VRRVGVQPRVPQQRDDDLRGSEGQRESVQVDVQARRCPRAGPSGARRSAHETQPHAGSLRTNAGEQIGADALDEPVTGAQRERPRERRKELAAGTYKGSWGHHPLGAWCDNTSESLAFKLRAGSAGSNTVADHIEVLDQAIAQIPARH
jgi:hypothetical protein